MKKLAATLACLAALGLAASAAQAHYPAQGNFGAHGFDASFLAGAEGPFATQAGSHPFGFEIRFLTNVDGEDRPEGRLRDLHVTQAPGLVADTTAYPRCSTTDFLETSGESGVNECPLDTTVGIAATGVGTPGGWFSAPIFNLEPPPGVLLRLGFRAVAENIVIEVTLGSEPPYLPVATVRNTPQLVDIFASKTQLWGDPSSSVHDAVRGACGFRNEDGLPPEDLDAFRFESAPGAPAGGCPVTRLDKPLLTMPTACSGPLRTSYEALSWEGDSDVGSALTHDAEGRPEGLSGCGALPTFNPSIDARPTSSSADSPSGLDFELGIDDPGLTSNKEGARAKSQIRKVVVTLPKGMTVNPSQAEGLDTCTEADLARESADSPPGAGCPLASKIGALEVDSPLVDETVRGSLFVATPYHNRAGDSLLAVYAVFKSARLGIVVKQPLRIDPDPETGQLVTTTAEDIPQLPFSSFRLRFREGGRSPLVTPPDCGAHAVVAKITPWSGIGEVEDSSSFQILSGPDGRPCPAGALPFEPGFRAGSRNNAAAAHSPFAMRLTRRDGDQDLTRFDATLPPGVSATLAGVGRCSEAEIAAAKAKSGRDELASSSCPASSQIGTVRAGAGTGSQLTYVSGHVYLAGPFGGAPVSAVAIVPAVAGPYDVGTVVYRQALQINPRSGVVSADGAASDPLPHILAGIPLRVRDVQVEIDRPGFVLNPTSCAAAQTSASIWGGGENPFSRLDDSPVQRLARYQASGCANLAFAPRLALRLKGGTRRGAFPALHLVLRPRAHNADLSRLALRLPRSEFVEQGHFRTICTRVQFAAAPGHGARCPKGSVYGHARVWTPLIDGLLKGPVYLRSSNHNLPDVVLALHGPPSLPVDLEVPARIDSVKGGLRAIASATPDLPFSRAVVDMRGGQKGLFVNSTDICRGRHHARAALAAHNGRRKVLRPLLRAQCPKRKRHRRHRRG